MTTNGTHILTITGDVNEYGVDKREFSIEHRGPIESCALWEPCPPDQPCHRAEYDLEESTTEPPVFHGVEHAHLFEQGWCVRTDPLECFYESTYAAQQLPDLVADLVEPHGAPVPIGAGRFDIDTDYEGDGEFSIAVVRRLAQADV